MTDSTSHPSSSAFPDENLDDALMAAWGPPRKEGESVVQRIERLTRVRSRVLLHEPPEEDGAPLLRVGAAEGKERPAEDSRYRIVGEIARGGVGVVYKGRDRDLRRDVALKVLRTELADRPEVVTRFIEEAQVGAQLQHPGIVPVYGLGLQPDGRPHFAMKLVKGRTLAALLGARPSVEHERRRYLEVFHQTAQTVSYAHARGVLHRDLKPANVMVGAFGEVLVVDWGFGKVLGRGERAEEPRAPERTVIATVRTESTGSDSITGSVMGTPAYMSPEQAIGRVEELDARSDVFGLGAILCEILTGKAPYVGESQDILLQAIQARLDPALERLDACGADPELIALAKRCLSPMPADRPADAGVVAATLGTWLAAVDERVRKAEVDAVEQRGRLEQEQRRAAWERRAKRKTRLGAAAALLALLLGGGAYALVEGRRHARVQAARPAIDHAIQDAALLTGQHRHAEALDAARRAHALADTSGAPADLRERAGALVGEMRAELHAAEAEAERAARARALAADLTEVRMGRWDQFSPTQTDREYEETFARYGLDPFAADSSAFLAKVRSEFGGVIDDIVAALDAWAQLRWSWWKTWKRPGRPLSAHARALDPDPVRMRIRDALEKGGEAVREKLEEIAAAESSADLPSSTVSQLAYALMSYRSVEATHDFLRPRLYAHPEDFWVQGYLSQPGQTYDVEARTRALDHATAAVAIRPQGARAHANVMMGLKALGRHAEQLEVAGRARELAPGDSMTVTNHGAAMTDVGRDRDAEAAFKRALELDPRNATARLNLGAMRSRARDYKEAEAEIRRALEIDPSVQNGYANLSISLREQRRWRDAVIAGREAVEREPHSAHAWVALVGALNGLSGPAENERQEALDAARKAVELDPASAYGYGALSYALGRVGQSDEALRAAEEAVRLSSDNALAYVALAEAHSLAEEPEKAIPAFEEALRLDPTLPKSPGRLAVAYLQVNRFREGERICRQILEKRPGDPQTLDYLTQALLAQKRVKEAEAAFARISEDGKASLQLTLTRARLLEARGKKKTAVRAYERALEENPRNVLARRRLAELLWGMRGAPEAIELLRQGLELLPKSYTFEHQLGLAYTKNSQYREAEAIFKKCRERRPDDPTPHMNLSVIAFRHEGEPYNAIPHLRRAYACTEGATLVDYNELRSSIAVRLEEARQQIELLEDIDSVLAGHETYDAHDLGWMLDIHWARDERKKASRLLELIEASDADATRRAATYVNHAWFCLVSPYKDDLWIPLEEGEADTLRVEALDCLERLLALEPKNEAGRRGIEDSLREVRANLGFKHVRDACPWGDLPADERARWKKVWAAADALPDDDEEGK